MRRSPAQWAAILSAYEESPLSQRAFAASVGISLSALLYQLRKQHDAQPLTPSGGFVVVGAQPPASDSSSLFEVRLGRDVALRCSTLPDVNWLVGLLTAWEQRGC